MIYKEIVNVKICHQNYKHYENKGYFVNRIYDIKNRPSVPEQYIDVNWEDIPHSSKEKILLKCDICGKIFERKILDYYHSHKSNDIDTCCKKCQYIKSNKTKIEKYGTTNPAEIAKQINGNIGRSLKYGRQDIEDMCKNKDYKIFKKNNDVRYTVKSKIKLFCTIHNCEFETSVECLMNKNRTNCPMCNGEKISKRQSKSTIEEVKKICDEKGYTLLTDHISNCDDRIEYICNKHKDYGAQKTSLYGLRKYSNNCRMCRIPKNENHWHWNGGISSDRDRIKNTPQYKKWIKDVFERDDYTCQCCGKKGTYLEAHHLYNFSEYPELRMDVDNGITLCHECHSISVPTSFHGVYTQFHNTPEQLFEYIENYKMKKCS